MTDPASTEETIQLDAVPTEGDNNVEASAPAPAPVEAAPAPAPGPTVDKDGNVGELTEQAKIAIGHVQQQQQNATMQIGQLEIKKNQLLEQFQGLQAQAKRILDSEGDRMGIPRGTPWHISPEGKARLAGP